MLPAPFDRHSSKFNVSAAVSLTGRSQIFIFKENLVATLYTKILTDTIIPAGNLNIGGQWKLLLDNDPKHTSKLAKACLHENGVLPIWPSPRSPDTNIIENVWPMLMSELQKLGHQTANTLANSIKKAWSKIPQGDIRNCVLSMSRRCEMLIAAKGDHIKY